MAFLKKNEENDFEQTNEFEVETETVEVEEPTDITTPDAETPEYTNDISVVSESARFAGNIETEGHVLVKGYLQGNIEARGNVEIQGVVTSETVKCNDLSVKSGKVESAITANGVVTVDANVVITGDITCKSITVSGLVTGNIAADHVVLKSTSVVKGSVTAKELGMEIGAKLAGALSIAE